VKRALGRLDGVRHIEAVPGTLRVTITPANDRVLELAAIAPVLWGEGIRVLAMRIVAEGTVESEGEGWRFRIRGWPEAWPVEGKVPAEGEAAIRATVEIADGASRLRIL